MSTDQSGAPSPAIRYEEVTETATHRWVEIPPGAVVPRYRVSTGFVVFPLVPSTVRKTTYRDGVVWKTEDMTLDPAQPYFIAGFEPGVEVSVQNTGTETATYKKVPVRSPQELPPAPSPKPASTA